MPLLFLLKDNSSHVCVNSLPPFVWSLETLFVLKGFCVEWKGQPVVVKYVQNWKFEKILLKVKDMIVEANFVDFCFTIFECTNYALTLLCTIITRRLSSCVLLVYFKKSIIVYHGLWAWQLCSLYCESFSSIFIEPWKLFLFLCSVNMW